MSVIKHPVSVPVGVPKNLLKQLSTAELLTKAQALYKHPVVTDPVQDPAAVTGPVTGPAGFCAHGYALHGVEPCPTCSGVDPAPGPAQVTKAKAKAKPAQAPQGPPVPNVAPGHPGPSDAAQIPVQTPGVPLLGKAGTAFAVTLPLDLLAKVMKPIVGMGGWQRIMSELQAVTVINQPAADGQGGFYQTGTMTLTPHLLTKLIALSVKHGSGGYQAVIRHVVCLALNQHKAALLGGA